MDMSDIEENVDRLPERAGNMLHTIVERQAPRAESTMKRDAPWQDQTGNARQGLKARAVRDPRGDRFHLVLFHTMPYGIWLETRWGGKYAIILPTLDSVGRDLMEDVRALFRRMR